MWLSSIPGPLVGMALAGKLAWLSPPCITSGPFHMVSLAGQPDFLCSYSGLQKSKKEAACFLKSQPQN